MSESRNTVVPAAFLFLEKEGKVLLQRRFHTGFQDGNYTFISGHVEFDESPSMAICREAKEEGGIEIQPQDVQCIQILYRKSFDAKKSQFNESEPERVDFFFTAKKWSGEPKIMEPNKCDDLGWFPLSKLPTNISPIVKTFLDQRKGKWYMESGY